MRLRLLLLAGLAAAVAIVPFAAQGGAAKQRIKTTKREIEAIGMDGPLVAYDLSARFDSGCNKVYTWNVNTNGGKVVSGDGTCEADDTSTGAGVTQIGVAGNRIAWLIEQGGNTEEDFDVYSSSLPTPKEKHLLTAMAEGDVDTGDIEGDFIDGVFGDGDLLAVSSYTAVGDSITNAKLQTIGPARVRAIARGERAITTVAVGAGRIATAAGDGKIRLWSSTGRLLHTYDVGQGHETALTQHRLIVFTDKGMKVFDTGPGGKSLAVYKAPERAGFADAEGDLAVYTVSCDRADTCERNVWVVRISTGKTIRFVRAPSDVVGIQIEPAGLVYAYNTRKGGTIVVSPLSQVEAALR